MEEITRSKVGMEVDGTSDGTKLSFENASEHVQAALSHAVRVCLDLR